MDLFRKLRDTLKRDTAKSPATQAELARLLLQRGDDQLALQHPLQAIDCYQQANQIFTQLADQFHQASTLGRLGNAYSAMGNREQAIKHYQAALDRSQAIPDLQIACAALGNLGLLAQYADQPEQALNYFFQARDYARTLHDTSVMRFTLNNIANTFFEQGQYEQAITYCEQFIEANKTTDNRRDDAICLSKMGLAYVHLHQRERGRSLLQQAQDLLVHSTNPEARSDLVRVKAFLAQLDSNGI